jgi:NAD(P)-dependent dehydrogenase (short-subunit alcohol dehydrogenase family)
MSDLSYYGKVVIVTGAGRGIGRAHALLLARRGASVVVNDRATAGNDAESDLAADVAAEISDAGGKAIANSGDVSKEADVARLVVETLEAFSQIDVVINNAGTVHDFVGLDEEPEGAIDRQLAVHVRSSYLVTRAAWPHLAQAEAGRVLCTSSTRIFGGKDGASYSAAKGGVFGLMRAVAVEGASVGINANAVLPLAWTRQAAHGAHTPIGALMQRRSPDPRHVANAVAWLCHESCDVTGETFTVGLGRVARVVLAVTEGIFEVDATPESLRDQWDAVCDERNMLVPSNNADETALFFRNWETA